LPEHAGIGIDTSRLPKAVDIGNAQSKFEIHWSINITPSKTLTASRIEKINHVSTTWDEQ